MDERKIGLLENITEARGASPNEAATARKKIAEYAARMSQYKTARPTQVHIYEDVSSSIEEQRFRMEYQDLKMTNRKRWKAEI